MCMRARHVGPKVTYLYHSFVIKTLAQHVSVRVHVCMLLIIIKSIHTNTHVHKVGLIIIRPTFAPPPLLIYTKFDKNMPLSDPTPFKY
jgi:hypothetical protein